MAEPNIHTGEFQDPLENYDPKTYNDAMEKALAEEHVLAIQSTPYASIRANETVANAVKQLADQHVACLLVEDDDKLVGIFTDREVLDKVILEYDQVKDLPVGEVMTKEPVFVRDTDSAAAALCVMAVSGFRHVPVLDVNDQILGIVSPQRITKFLMRHLRPSES